MTKMTGLGSNFYVGGFDLSNDAAALDTIADRQAVLPSTGIDKLAMERFAGHKDGELSFTTYLNDAAGQEHPVLSALPRTDVQLAAVMGVPAIGSHTASILAKQTSYDPTRAEDGSLRFSVQALGSSFGLEWGQLLTAGKRTDTTATSPATGLDTLASASFGCQAYLHVFSFTGTSVTVTLQDSADNSSFAGFTGSAFAAASAVGTQRIATGSTQTVRRYVRAITTGTFSNAVFAVVLVKNPTATVF